jgi:gamma-glutamylputrescine oxidase
MNIADTYYRATANTYAPHATLQGGSAARVCVVGGGYAGLATALGLTERGVRDVVLVEAEQLGHGASGRNGGFVFGGYSLGEAALRAQLGDERARRVYGWTIDAINLIRARIQHHRIACAMVDEGVLWANWFRDESVLRRRAALLSEHYGVHWAYVSPAQLQNLVRSTRYGAALWERNAFHVHPLNYAIGLAEANRNLGVRMHEHTRAVSLTRIGSGWRVRTTQGHVDAERVVLACGGYLSGLNGRADRSLLPIATYVMATEPLGERLAACFPGTRAAVYDTRFAFDYYRPLADTRLLWGGRISILNRAPTQVAKLLRRDVAKVFPALRDVRVDFAWSGLMGYARHEMPQVAELEPGLWAAQGFGGHGLATTTAVAEAVASAIAERDPRYQDLARYDFPNTYKPLGYLGAQATYWWLQAKDAWKAIAEHRG